jgi:hypothetical protein
MSQTVEIGSILIEESPSMRLLGLGSEPYSGTWNLVQLVDGVSLDRKIHAAGWNFFFMAGEIKVMFLGALGAEKIKNALKRILVKVRRQNFNSLEVTGIVAKRFLGVPYATVSAHSRHIQQSCSLDGTDVRQTFKRDAEWARG